MIKARPHSSFRSTLSLADDDPAVLELLGNRTIEACPSLLSDLASQAFLNLKFSAWPEPLRGDLRGASPHALRDVFGRNNQILSALVRTLQDDMNVGPVSVPVIGGHPLQSRAEIPFDLAHEVACIRLQIPKLGAVLRRDHHAEVMAIVLTPFDKLVAIDIVRRGVEQTAGLSIARRAVAPDVVNVPLE